MLHIPCAAQKMFCTAVNYQVAHSNLLNEGGRGYCVFPSNYYYWFALSLNGKVQEGGRGHLEVNAARRLSHSVVLQHLSYTNS